MRPLLFIIPILLTLQFSALAQDTIKGQQSASNSLKAGLEQARDDNTRLKYINGLFWHYLYITPDSALPYAQQFISLARQMNSDTALYYAYSVYGEYYHLTGNYPLALQYFIKSLQLAQRKGDFTLIGLADLDLSRIYIDQGNNVRALQLAGKAKAIYDKHFTPTYVPYSLLSDTSINYFHIVIELTQAYEQGNQLDSALKYNHYLKDASIKMFDYVYSPIEFNYGNIYSKKQDYTKAIQHYHQGMYQASKRNNYKDFMDNAYGIAKLYHKMNRTDSSTYFAKKILEANKMAHYPLMQLNALNLLATTYKAQNNTDSIAKYFELTLMVQDSIFKKDKLMQMQNMTFNEQLRQQEIQEQEQKQRYRYRLYVLLGGIVFLCTIVYLLYRSIAQKQKAKVAIEKAYAQLKATQAQLIQSEKMASLGELTAGIAHEIQNPLNFVNNFSETNTELIQELRQELNGGHIQQANDIAADIEDNEQKINHHGKRADSIIKNMLEHSRTSKGEKQPTDINALIDEYLRLAYHGFRAKDKSFNTEMDLQLDPSIEKLNMVPQEIGRVLLNIFNNAFYAVAEKGKQAIDGYEPIVSVSSKRVNSNLEIEIKDNGVGIPQQVIDKIFQPFFTTKPTGQGTGLGLSLSYDIIKAYGGEIKAESTVGDGSDLIIKLPV